jgi:hypothetical protein
MIFARCGQLPNIAIKGLPVFFQLDSARCNLPFLRFSALLPACWMSGFIAFPAANAIAGLV